MKNAIIVHGKPGKKEYYSSEFPAQSNMHWIPWLQKQLLIKDIEAHTPEMFKSFAPDYKRWQQEFERYDCGPETILVGHSCGGGFLVRWLSEQPEVRVDKLVLVAPWLDPEREDTKDFFEFTIDSDLSNRVKEIHIFKSLTDEQSVLQSINIINQEISENITEHVFEDAGHFCLGNKMESEEFPELLAVVLS